MTFLTERLKTSVQHSLLDCVMENFLTAPICHLPSHDSLRQKVIQEVEAMNSELPASDMDSSTVKKQTLMDKLRYKMRSFSFSKHQSGKKFADESASSNKVDVEGVMQQLIEDYEDGALGNLNPIFAGE